MITIIETTSDDKQELIKAATDLVNRNLAACCQITGPFTSVNHWSGKMQHTQEYRIAIKTIADHLEVIKKYLSDNHSYDLPEITWGEHQTTPEYQNWVEEETRSN